MQKKNKLSWKTEKRKINDLMPYPNNPRILTNKQAEEIRKSLEKFNLVEIPAVNTDKTIIAGHQRLKIMQLIGRGNETIDVRIPNRKLTPSEVKEYNVRSNKNTGEFDYDILGNLFEVDELLNMGFDKKELLGESGGGTSENPEVEFSQELLLEHNYIVLYFDNSFDWQVALDKFGLKKVKDLIPRKGQPVGVGRVIKGKDWIEKIK